MDFDMLKMNLQIMESTISLSLYLSLIQFVKEKKLSIKPYVRNHIQQNLFTDKILHFLYKTNTALQGEL